MLFCLGGGVDDVSKTIWEEIRNVWENSDITFKALGEQYGFADSTVRSRKNREKWQRDETSNATPKPKNVATKKATSQKTKKAEKEPVIENAGLNDKQKDFCIYYIKYFNATKAYQKAYEANYTTAMVNGSRLLGNTKVKDEITRLKEERAQEKLISVDDIIQKYIDIAFTDITDFTTFGKKPVKTVADFDDEGKPIYEDTDEEYNFLDFKNSDEIDGTLVSEVKMGKDGVAIKLQDKMKALDRLADYFDVLSPSVQDELVSDKTKAEIEFIKARTGLIRGEKKDTSKLDALIEGRIHYEKMMKEREKNG